MIYAWNAQLPRYAPKLPVNARFFTDYGYLQALGVPASAIELPKIPGRSNERVWETNDGQEPSQALVGEQGGRWRFQRGGWRKDAD